MDFASTPRSMDFAVNGNNISTPSHTTHMEDISPDSEVTVIESLCMECNNNGVSRLLPIRIPYFRDIVIISFECPHCKTTNNEVMSANEIQPKGVNIVLNIDPVYDSIHEDLNRQVIKSGTASVTIPEIDFEIPCNSRGEINTVEGIVSVAAQSLEFGQVLRHIQEPEVAEQVQKIIDALNDMSQGTRKFTLILNDPSGNSFLQNPNAPNLDPHATISTFSRTREQCVLLGLLDEDEVEVPKIENGEGLGIDQLMLQKLDTHFNVFDRAVIIPGTCHGCHQDCETRMCVTELPHFKDVIIMVTDCVHCGYRDTEVKPGGGIAEKGRRVTLRVKEPKDLNRDILKSDSAELSIPELELFLSPGTLGGKYTTIEGIVQNIHDQLFSINPFTAGDSSTTTERAKFIAFVESLSKLTSESFTTFTLILDDPAGNAYIEVLLDIDGNDPNIITEDYERSYEQNEDLGLNDMNTENYK